ncbi:MAG: zinc ribbon domain-containing protein [Thermoproteota archaeon]
MYCPKCGRQIPDDANICPYCGVRVEHRTFERGSARWLVVYGVLWLLTVIAYSVPWAKVDGKVFVGWNFTMPFSITYVIGMLLGLIVIIVKYRPVLMTIVAGVLMMLGLVGAAIGFGAAQIAGGLTGVKVSWEAGPGWAFILTMLYMVAGAYAARKIPKSRRNP